MDLSLSLGDYKACKLCDLGHDGGAKKPEGRVWLHYKVFVSKLEKSASTGHKKIRKSNLFQVQPWDMWLRVPSLRGRQRHPFLQTQGTVLP